MADDAGDVSFLLILPIDALILKFTLDLENNFLLLQEAKRKALEREAKKAEVREFCRFMIFDLSH